MLVSVKDDRPLDSYELTVFTKQDGKFLRVIDEQDAQKIRKCSTLITLATKKEDLMPLYRRLTINVPCRGRDWDTYEKTFVCRILIDGEYVVEKIEFPIRGAGEVIAKHVMDVIFPVEGATVTILEHESVMTALRTPWTQFPKHLRAVTFPEYEK